MKHKLGRFADFVSPAAKLMPLGPVEVYGPTLYEQVAAVEMAAHAAGEGEGGNELFAAAATLRSLLPKED